MILMVIVGLLLALVSVWLPWWTLAIVGFIMGAAFSVRWWQTGILALMILGIDCALAANFDWQSHGLISHRIATLFSLPSWGLYILAALPGAWFAAFFARLGSSTRSFFPGR